MPATARVTSLIPQQRQPQPALQRPQPLAQRQPAPTWTRRPAGASSLTQPGARQASCPRCGSERITELSMTLTDGSAVDFLSCHSCEHRRWTQGGEPVALPHILDKSRKVR